MNTVYDRERVLRARLNAFIKERLGLPADDYYARLDHHAKPSITFDVYAHALPDMQEDAAALVGAALYGR